MLTLLVILGIFALCCLLVYDIIISINRYGQHPLLTLQKNENTTAILLIVLGIVLLFME